VVGFNYRHDHLHGRGRLRAMEQLERFVAAKRRIARRYDEALGDLPGAGSVSEPDWAESACWFSGVTLTRPTARRSGRCCATVASTRAPFWKPINLQLPYRHAPTAELPVCEKLWQTILTLPCSTGRPTPSRTRSIAAVRRCVTQVSAAADRRRRRAHDERLAGFVLKAGSRSAILALIAARTDLSADRLDPGLDQRGRR